MQHASAAGLHTKSLADFLVGYNDIRRAAHQSTFPWSDNLFALIFTVSVDLTEQQRERMQSAMSLRSQRVHDYSFAGVRGKFIELFCAPRSSLDSPNLGQFSGGRSFCVLGQGEMGGSTGYWVEDDNDGEVGFPMEFEDTFGNILCKARKKVPWSQSQEGPTKGQRKRQGS